MKIVLTLLGLLIVASAAHAQRGHYSGAVTARIANHQTAQHHSTHAAPVHVQTYTTLGMPREPINTPGINTIQVITQFGVESTTPSSAARVIKWRN